MEVRLNELKWPGTREKNSVAVPGRTESRPQSTILRLAVPAPHKFSGWCVFVSGCWQLVWAALGVVEPVCQWRRLIPRSWLAGDPHAIYFSPELQSYPCCRAIHSHLWRILIGGGGLGTLWLARRRMD